MNHHKLPLFTRGSLIIFPLLTVTLAVLTVIMFSKLSDDQRQIQASRLAACQDINRRHNNTIRILNREIAKLPPARRARAEASRESTILLISALAPKRDCQNLIH